MINYSLAMRKNPQKPDEPKKAYAVPQVKEIMNLDDFAEHITSHGCVYSKGDILAILTIAIKCVREQLLAGNAVRLGDLGKFSLGLSSRGASEFGSFEPSTNITKVRARWSPSPQLADLKLYAQFTRVLPKTASADAKSDYYGK